jgi:Rnl2 family RNA ligase
MPAPRFRPFLKMSARGAGTTGGTWVATEKIHGANFVVGATADGVWFGKRKAWLEASEPFFGWQLIAKELAAAAREVFRAIGAPQVVMYGELFGGGYPHADVATVPALQPVQTGVWYAPDVRWAPFDMLVAADDEHDGELLAFSDVEALAADAGLVTPPVVGRGRLADLEALPVRAPTRVPAALGLPPLDDNIGEGLVLKQDVRAAPADRPIVKRKIAEMDEARFDESAAWQPGDVGEDVLATWAARMVNPARIASARSKVGEHAAQIADEIVLDVLVDLEAAFPTAWRAIDDAAQDRLAAIVRACLSTTSAA